MGNVSEYLQRKFCNKLKKTTIKNKDINDSSIKFEDNILKIDFFCPICGNRYPEIPEILKFDSVNSTIVFRCLKRDKTFERKLENYKEEINAQINNKCGRDEKCLANGDERGKDCEKYCLNCQCFLCDTCSNEIDRGNIAKTVSKKDSNLCCSSCFCPCSSTENKNDTKIHYHVKDEEMNVICPSHGLVTSIPCDDCQKNCCPKCFDKKHKWHKKGNLSYSDINKARDKIIKKDEKLLKMKEFYDMVRSAAESDENIYKKNLKNVADCINEENNRNKYETDLAIYKIKQIKQNEQNEQN